MSHEDDLRWMRKAIELSRLCPPSTTAFSVGAVIVDADGQEMATGYSRETDAHVHAEESALAKLPAGDSRLTGATIYSTLEPCSERKSRPIPCAELIVQAGLRRVVIAWREPDLFVSGCTGVELMESSGIEVTEIPEMRTLARAANKHLAGDGD